MKAAIAALVLGSALAGCGAGSTAAVADVTRAFYRAVSQEHGRAACRLLAPTTADELVQTTSLPCRVAILRAGLPAVGPVVDVARFGNQAQVRVRGDTVFLSEFPAGWRIVALDCTPRRVRPYDCQVQN